MELDKTTLYDLAVFANEEDFSVFGKLNEAITSSGRDEFKKMLYTPLKSVSAITDIQLTLKQIGEKESGWTKLISNGTIMVVERYFHATIDEIPAYPNKLSALTYKVFSGQDYSLIKYSAKHCFDFIKGMRQLQELLHSPEASAPLQKVLSRCQNILQHTAAYTSGFATTEEMPHTALLRFGHFIRYRFKTNMHNLLQMHATLDAWHGMAIAIKKFQLVFPELVASETPVIEARGLYHILLEQPVGYDTQLNRDAHFLFLTGANMAGKSTFIKAVGIAVFLAHAGMAVPAAFLRLSVFDGMLSNINMADNIIKGESYFYNEVQRVKATLQKVSDGKKWLILIDELFKGTNVEDAMKCSTAVIEGLLKVKGSLFILSTHLYEIAQQLQGHTNISFHYFETQISGGQLQFNYTLKPGVSNDRLGYLILKNEGVVKMLEDL
ncbi:MAG: DNA mismatch repair protein MutS [Chitinophagaceae bacterium]|nr:DNA mismatch repair protein MutS [Chitinophagaceae bacterium]